jgi:hypothetical protein
VIVFENIKPGCRLRGLDPSGLAEVVQVAQFGADALNVVFRVDGRVDQRLVMRGEETGFEFVEAGRTYAFDADGSLLRLASEAYRIRLAYLFDPYIAVTASQIEALPHQITAVYCEMLPRQPLRFLLADDPGAGKTIMAGLLIKELRGRTALDALPSLREARGEALQGLGRVFLPILRRQSAIREPAFKRRKQGSLQGLQASPPSRRRGAACASVSGPPTQYASAHLRTAQKRRNGPGGRIVEADAEEISRLCEPCRVHRLRINVEIIWQIRSRMASRPSGGGVATGSRTGVG